MRHNALHTAVAGALAVTLLAACDGSAPDKAGGDAAPVILKMATLEGRGAPYAAGVEEFVRRVDDLSDGAVQVEVVWEGAVEYLGAFGPGSDQGVARLVQSRRLDLALIPARAWDELAVTSLQALQAPFLVSSEDLVEQVVQTELADEMLAGLEKAGVVGLALLPEGLRHPVGFARPLLRLEDFTGARIRALPSNASNRLLRALGAKPVDICCDALYQAVSAGEIDGAESGYAWGNDLPSPNTFTGNVTLFPKVNVVVANGKSFGGLSDEQQDILRQAAADALRHVVRNDPAEAERVAVYCGNGGTIAVAAPADVVALERAAEPVYAALEADPQTKSLIARIRELKARVGPASRVPSCDPGSSPPAPTTADATRRIFPEGVYRADLSPEFLIGKGMDAQTAHDVGGIVTLTIDDGTWRGHTQTPRDVPDCGGAYIVEAGRISLRDDSEQCGAPWGTVVMTARWKLVDRELTFLDVRVGRPLEWGAKPWKKIG